MLRRYCSFPPPLSRICLSFLWLSFLLICRFIHFPVTVCYACHSFFPTLSLSDAEESNSYVGISFNVRIAEDVAISFGGESPLPAVVAAVCDEVVSTVVHSL